MEENAFRVDLLGDVEVLVRRLYILDFGMYNCDSIRVARGHFEVLIPSAENFYIRSSSSLDARKSGVDQRMLLRSGRMMEFSGLIPL